MLIKNKFRGVQQRPVNVEKYEPEYKKLGLTPEIGIPMFTPKPNPRNIRVNSGQNEELSWIPKQNPIEKPSNVMIRSSQKESENIRERTFVNQNYEDGANRNVPIAYDDVPDYTPSVVAEGNNQENVTNFSEVSYGEFVLIFNNEILGAGTYDEVTAAIEEILLSDESGTISPNSLVVLKRMQIMTGVLIKDV